MSDCIFCKIANGEIPSNTVFENNEFKVIMDVAPANPGHVLVIPKSHAEDIFEIDGGLAAKGFGLAKRAACALKKASLADGVNILQNNGEAASQTVRHFHIHVIPRRNNDGVTIKSEVFKMTEEETEKVKSNLIKEMSINSY